MFASHFKYINYIYIVNKLSLFRNNISKNNTDISNNINNSLNKSKSLNNNKMGTLKDKVKHKLFWFM